MSYQAMAWATSIKLPMTEKIVLLMLANRANHDDGSCYPSINRVSEECGISRDTVIRSIKKLEDKDLLTVIRTKKEDGENNVNKYFLQIGGSSTQLLRGSSTQLLGSSTQLLRGSSTQLLGSSTQQLRGSSCVQPEPVTLFNQSINQSINKDIPADAGVKSCEKKSNRVPYKEIENLYHECLPMLPEIYKLNEKRKRRVKALWHSELEELSHWKNYFMDISRSKFLTGMMKFNGGRVWRADFDFIINESNFIKIAEGKYDE